MVKVKVRDLELDFSGVQEHILNTSLENVLKPLRKGEVPRWIPPRRESPTHYGDIVRQLEEQRSEMTDYELEISTLIREYREMLCNFDRKKYEELRRGRVPMAMTWGEKLAEKLRDITEGYQPKPGHGQLVDPVEFYNDPRNHNLAQDPNSAISYIMKLNIKKED